MSEFSQVAAATGGQLALRRDIAVLPAPGDEAAGAVMLFDPLRHQFFKLRGVVARLLTGDADVSATGAEREAVAAFGAQNELLVAGPQGWKKHAATAARRRRNLFSAATHGYLFFKIPLLRPQRLLTTMWPAAALFFSRTFFILTMLAAFCGLYLVQRQWDQFTATFKAFLTLEGAAIYALTLVAVKSLHELGHGFACHKRGVAVPTMGVAFMVLFPVLYTDTTGAWRLKRRDRLAIDLAGVATELTIAAWATLAWAFLPDGFARDAAFSLAAVSWVMSLAVNLNPFMRFDGYYAFSDAIGFENLNQRGFALARWRLREFLFGFGDPAPVETTPAMRRLVTAHAFATWIYRLALFIGIALLVYHFFIKLVAIVLFAIEIGYFIAMPVVREVKNWWTMRSRMRLNFATMRTVLLALSILAIAFAP
nr:hypothetical protein [Rhizobiaceae bacterium]